MAFKLACRKCGKLREAKELLAGVCYPCHRKAKG